jgi:small subunit ribosomal protein S5
MSGVSAQGKKRGRAKNTMKKKDLNRGQQIGYGKARVSWPVLTKKPTFTEKGKGEVENQITEMDEAHYTHYQERLEEEQKGNMRKGFSRAVHPLDRGWAGGRPLGRRYGPPQAPNREQTFENFETILLEFKTVYKMTGNLGRVRRNSLLMVTGNGAGAVGYTVTAGKHGQNMKALRRANNKAGLRLVYVDRYEDRTIYHDFFTQFGHTRIFVQQQPPGYGVVAHRAIKEICKLAGIKDLYAKCEGSGNVQHVVKAFMLGLLRQRTHQALADEKGLHLVEMRKENDYYPRVVASPSNGKVTAGALAFVTERR